MAQKGFAVISGSNTVVAKILENGTVVFGDDAPVNAEVSGTLVLNLPTGSGVDGKVLQIGTANSASIAQLSASQIVNVPAGNLAATNVQDALNELQTEIDSISTNANLDVSSSAGSGSIVLATETFSILGDASGLRTKTSYDEGTNTLRVDLTDNVDLVGALTASGILVDTGSLTVSNGSISGSGALQVGGATTLGGTLTVNATDNLINGSLRVNGDLVVSGSTVTLEVQNLKVEDPIVVLGSSSAGAPLDGDRGLIFAQSGSANDPAFGWDYVDSVFRLGTTADDGTTPNLTITPDATLQLGELSASSHVQVGGDLTVAGAVNLPAGSISNAELENSSINISGGVGIVVTSLESISLGGTGSIALALDELSTVTVDVAADSLAIVDASNSSASALTTIVGLASGMASTGLAALNGQLSVVYGSGSGTAVQGDTQVTFSGVANEIEIVSGSPLTLGSGGTITIGLPDSVTIGNLTLTGSLVVSGSTTLGTGNEDTVTVVGSLRHPIFSVSSPDTVAGFPLVPDDYTTNPAAYSGYSFYLTSSAAASNGITPGSGSWAIANKWYFNENGVWHASTFYAVV